MGVSLKRAYDEPAAGDGRRYLVERLWPRGVSKERLALDAWLKDIAPSPGLRKWYDHRPERLDEFSRRYEAELKAPANEDTITDLARKASSGQVTLVFATRDASLSSAAILKRVIEESRLA